MSVLAMEVSEDDEMELAPEWASWLVDNYVDGIPLDELLSALKNAGVPEALGQRALREVRRNPLLRSLRKKLLMRDQLQALVALKRQLASLGRVDAVERRFSVSADDFFENYYTANRPIILTDVTRDWPALSLWSRPQYFAEKFGNTEVSVCMGRQADPYCDRNFKAHLRTMSMRDYATWVAGAGETNDGYLISNNRLLEDPKFHDLLHDIVPPTAYVDPAQFYTHMSFWFGPAGTVTPLHHDGNNILFCQVVGRKEVYLVSPWETELMERAQGFYAHAQVPGGMEGQGRRLPDEAFPWPALRVVLEPGEALFLPVGWWHQVRALDMSVSISFLNFRQPNQFHWYAPGKLNEM
jgi:hypothetical protein